MHTLREMRLTRTSDLCVPQHLQATQKLTSHTTKRAEVDPVEHVQAHTTTSDGVLLSLTSTVKFYTTVVGLLPDHL